MDCRTPLLLFNLPGMLFVGLLSIDFLGGAVFTAADDTSDFFNPTVAFLLPDDDELLGLLSASFETLGLFAL